MRIFRRRASGIDALGRFQLDRRIASRDDGELWLATSSDGFTIALKRINSRRSLARRRLVRRLRRMQLQRPAPLCAVLDVRIAGDAVWMAREWDRGVPVGRLGEAASLAAAPVTALTRGVLRALASLHERGIVHGHITPHNVFIERDGSVRLTDAGITVLAGDDADRRRADVAAAAMLISELWRADAGPSAPALAHLVSSSALENAESASAALHLVETCESTFDGTVGRHALAEVALRLLGEPPPEEVHRSALPGDGQAAPARQRSRRWSTPVAAAVAGGLALAVTAATLGVVRPWNATTVAKVIASPPATPSVPQTLAPTPSPSPTPTPAPTPTATPTPTPTPAVSATLTRADWDLPGCPCAPGGQTTVTTTVHLQTDGTVSVSWQFVGVDECTGGQTVVFSTTQSAQSGATQVSDTRTITIPGTHPLKVYVQTTAPMSIQSEALTVTPSSTTC
ncbi:MAG: hypothetical protein JOY80_11940 [Candidatus Dormibacteraeota bacterium]|nr:hypothetical protein [Candidatus Dormibacteraeota bacterium]